MISAWSAPVASAPAKALVLPFWKPSYQDETCSIGMLTPASWRRMSSCHQYASSVPWFR
jgi:hypothetical protein